MLLQKNSYNVQPNTFPIFIYKNCNVHLKAMLDYSGNNNHFKNTVCFFRMNDSVPRNYSTFGDAKDKLLPISKSNKALSLIHVVYILKKRKSDKK